MGVVLAFAMLHLFDKIEELLRNGYTSFVGTDTELAS